MMQSWSPAAVRSPRSPLRALRRRTPVAGIRMKSGARGFSRRRARAIRRTVEIRDAAPGDLQGLVDIYNDVIATSTAVFSSTPVSLDDRRQWWEARVAL